MKILLCKQSFSISYLAAPRPNLANSVKVASLDQSLSSITSFWLICHEGHMQPRNEVGTQSLIEHIGGFEFAAEIFQFRVKLLSHCATLPVFVGNLSFSLNESKQTISLQIFSRLSSKNFTWSTLEYIVPNEPLRIVLIYFHNYLENLGFL